MKLAALAALAALTSHSAAQQFGPFEALPGDSAVRASAGNQHAPFVANGNGVSLVVWQDGQSSLVDTVFGQSAQGSSGPPNEDIHGMLVDSDGNPLLNSPIAIAEGPFDQIRPRAAWNGTNFLVVYETSRPTQAFHSKGIEAVRVSASGVVIDTVPITVYDPPGTDEEGPVVASVGSNWLVAWRGRQPASQVPIVEGRVVEASGSLQPRRLLVPASAGFVTDMAMASSSGRHCLVFDISFGQGIRARLFDGAGTPTTAVITLEQGTGKRPAVAASPSGFLAAWTFGSNGLEATVISPAGVPSNPGGISLSPAQTAAIFNLSAGFDGSRYTLAYTRNFEVWAVQADVSGNPLTGPAIVDTSPRIIEDIAVGGANGKALITWTDRRESPSGFGVDSDDVYGLTLDAAGVTSAPHALSVSPPSQFGGRIAGDASTGFLIVFNSWNSGRTRVVAQAVDANGQPLAPGPFVIAEAPDRILRAPDVAWNGSEFFVVWSRPRSPIFGGTPPIVEGRRVLLDGTWLDPNPVEMVVGTRAAVDAVGRDFLVVSQFHHPTLSSNPRIHARRIDGATGTVLDPQPIFLDTAVGPLDVIGLNDRWIVAFAGIRLVQVDASGTAMPAVYSADTNSSVSLPLRLAANTSRTEVLLSYESRDPSGVIGSSDIRMRRFQVDGTSSDPFLGPVVTAALNAQLRPVGTWVGDEMLFAWVDHRAQTGIEPGIGDVYTGRLDAQANRLDGDGVALLATESAEGSIDVLGIGGGRALLSASMILRTGQASGIHRIHVATVRSSEIGATGCTQTVPNASGNLGRLQVFGSDAVERRDVLLVASGLTSNAFGFFIVSPMSGFVAQPGGSRGDLCLSSPIGRYVGPGEVKNSGPAGGFSLSVDPLMTPSPTGFVAITAGTTWTYQAWHRDVFAGASTSHFTSSVEVTFR